jgi:uncharacterized protein (TIGR04255 family)
MESRHYPRAPITEALVDLRVDYGRDVPLQELKRFGAAIRAEYPSEGTRNMVRSQITLDSIQQPHTQSSQTTLGYIFHSVDRRQAVQARTDGFTFSRFAPYQNWNQLTLQARQLWGLFVDSLEPKTVTRLAVRYINQINLPLRNGSLKFEDYLRTFPSIGVEDDVSLEQFFVRLVMPQVDLQAKLILTEALLPAKAEQVGVLLDIDLFRENMTLNSRSAEIWDILETFRDRKNTFFEASLTDDARRLFF